MELSNLVFFGVKDPFVERPIPNPHATKQKLEGLAKSLERMTGSPYKPEKLFRAGTWVTKENYETLDNDARKLGLEDAQSLLRLLIVSGAYRKLFNQRKQTIEEWY